MNHTSSIETTTHDHFRPSPCGQLPPGSGKHGLPVLSEKQHKRIVAEIFDVVANGGDEQISPLGVPEAEKVTALHDGEKGPTQIHHLSSAKTIVVFLGGATRIHLEADCILQTTDSITCFLSRRRVGQFHSIIAWGLEEAITFRTSH